MPAINKDKMKMCVIIQNGVSLFLSGLGHHFEVGNDQYCNEGAPQASRLCNNCVLY